MSILKQVKSILDNVGAKGFKGTYVVYIQKKGHWTDNYALFDLEFEENDDELGLDLCDYIEDNVKGEVCVRENEFEVIGADFHNNEDEYWAFPLVDDIW